MGFWDTPRLLHLFYITSKSPPKHPVPLLKALFADRDRKTENSAGHQTALFALGKALLLKLKKEGCLDRDVLAWYEVEMGDKNFVETE